MRVGVFTFRGRRPGLRMMGNSVEIAWRLDRRPAAEIAQEVADHVRWTVGALFAGDLELVSGREEWRP